MAMVKAKQDKTAKHELASLRANFAEWLYKNSEPIPNESRSNTDG